MESEMTGQILPENAMSRDAGTDPKAFRACFGHFATGVLVATCHPPGEAPIGITINSLSSVSLEPPMALFCLEERSATLAQFLKAGHFALNILAAGQEERSNRFARNHEIRGDDPFTVWSSGAPVFMDSLAVADCALQDVFGGGDHQILLGRVLDVGARKAAEPLLYYRGGYGRISAPEV